jgi:hypothetical protein
VYDLLPSADDADLVPKPEAHLVPITLATILELISLKQSLFSLECPRLRRLEEWRDQHTQHFETFKLQNQAYLTESSKTQN